MLSVPDIFYNSRRLRSGWRLLLFLIVTVFTGLAFFWPVATPLQWLLVKLFTPDPSRAQILYEGILVPGLLARSEEHTSELQSHSFISYAVFCLKNNIFMSN